VTSGEQSPLSSASPLTDDVRDSLGSEDAVIAARRRPMSERLELALSWNAVVAELRIGVAAATRHARRR
jgi:hypothetical protein